jgi:glycosyltransferase involved in cell wall biosynthesis
MRILHTLWTAHFGGIERLVLDLAQAQSASQDHQVDVLFGRGEGEMLEHYRSAALTFKSAHLRHGFDVTPSRMRELKQILSGYDVLHIHSFTPAMALAAAMTPAKIVYTEHGNFAIGRRATMIDRIKWQLLGHFLRRRVDFISFNSNHTRQIADHRYRLQAVQREVVYNGISFVPEVREETAMTPEIRDRIKGKFVVGTSSRFAAFKRIDRLIEAFAMFCREREAVLLLVGDGPLRVDFASMIQRLDIADKVVFAGYQANVRVYQDAMDVCVFPSQGEPFGLAAVETLALGKPTLVFRDSGGLAEIIGNCDTADVVDDVPQLAKRLEDHYAQRNHSDVMKARSRILYAHKFDIKTMAATFAVIYNRILPAAERSIETSAIPLSK